MSMDIPPEVKDNLPGIGGSLTALFFFRDRWPMRIALFACGVIAAKLVGPAVSSVMGASAEVAGYVTGLFSMALVAKVFDIIAAFDGKKFAEDVRKGIAKKFGGGG